MSLHTQDPPPPEACTSVTMPPASVTDIPLAGKQDESLGIKDYAEAMVAFIHDCATPLTIGVQGEWGSGKTSLLHMIQEDMEAQRIATSWVNTWEYSMFRAPAETAPAVIRGLVEELQRGFDGKWPRELDVATEKVKSVLKGLGRVAVNVAGAKLTGQANVAAEVLDGESSPIARAEIAELKRDLANLISTVIQSKENPYEKVVFFIDDLDRLEPPVAVNVLESIKNIFDLPHCVFLLAIDYDVVVKGLKHKFGEKTAENEREFRSFFDKIIQVPFSMPTGAYDIEQMLRKNLASMGFSLDDDMGSAYREVLATTVGGNPRSLKRYVNTFSLLRRLRDLNDRRENEGETEAATSQDDFVLFSLIGIQIAYPRIYSLLVKDSDFVNWDPDKTPDRIGVSLGDTTGDEATQARLKSLSEHELTDEAWERFVWLFCQRDPWLRARSAAILTTLNRIRHVVGDEDVENAIAHSMQIANMTSVDDDPDTQTKTQRRIRHDSWEACVQGQRERNIPQEVIDRERALHDWILQEFGVNNVEVNLTPNTISFKPLSDGRRGKNFLYVFAQKKGVKIDIWPSRKKLRYEENMSVDGTPSDSLRAELAESYEIQKR